MTSPSASVTAALQSEQVSQAIDRAVAACTEIRWHPAMRRRSAEVRAECTVRASAASAVLAGARVDQAIMRSLFLGEDLLAHDLTDITARGAARAVAEADRTATAWQNGATVALPGLLSRLHTAAAAGLIPEDQLGRPSTEPGATEAIARVVQIVGLSAEVPALAVAAMAHAELATAQPFPAASGVVGRALARALVVGRGLDPMSASVWEHAMATGGAGTSPVTMLQAYASGTEAGLVAWLTYWADVVTEGVAEGNNVAMSVLAGSLS